MNAIVIGSFLAICTKPSSKAEFLDWPPISFYLMNNLNNVGESEQPCLISIVLLISTAESPLVARNGTYQSRSHTKPSSLISCLMESKAPISNAAIKSQRQNPRPFENIHKMPVYLLLPCPGRLNNGLGW